MSRQVPTYAVSVAWTGQQTGVFRLDNSLLDGTDVLPGVFGNYAYDDISGDVKMIQIERGRQGDPTSIEQGRCILKLKDSTGKYNPESAASPLAGYLDTHKPLKVEATGVVNYRQHVLNDSPLAYWRLGEASGIVAADASGNGNTGAYAGTVTLGETGAISGDGDTAFLPDGATGYMSLATSPVHSGAAMTVECWVKIDTSVSTQGTIIHHNVGAGAEGTFHLRRTAADKIFARIMAGAEKDYVSGVLGDGWHHLVLVVHGDGTASLYIDGAYDGGVTAAGTTGSAGALRVGMQTDGSLPLGEHVDEVALYDTALSAARILAHYSAGIGTFADTALRGLHYGFISKIQHNPARNARESTIESVDFFEWLNAGKPTIAATGATTVGAAIGLILDALEWTDADFRSLDTGSSIPDFSADGTKSALTLIQELLQVDLGFFFVSGSGVVTYQSRTTRWQHAAVDDTFSGDQISGVLPGVDKQSIINRQAVTRTGGVQQTASAADGKPYYDGSAISSGYLNTDAEALALAQFIVAVRKNGRPPTKGVTLLNVDDVHIARQLDRELGDRVLLTETSGGTSVEASIEGLSHTITPMLQTTRYTLSKRALDAYTLDYSALDGSDVLGY